MLCTFTALPFGSRNVARKGIMPARAMPSCEVEAVLRGI
jgi:hypothetical protein